GHFLHDVLRPRLLLPIQRDQQLGGAVLPSVPWRRIQRNAQLEPPDDLRRAVQEMGGGSFSPHLSSGQQSGSKEVEKQRSEVGRGENEEGGDRNGAGGAGGHG